MDSGASPRPWICPSSAARTRDVPTTASAAENLSVRERCGKDKRHRLLHRRTCKARISEPKGTPLFGSRLTQEKAVLIFEHLAERNGVRATARLACVNRNTVVRYARLAGDHARHLHGEVVAFSADDP